MTSDSELIRRIRGGDAEALAALVRRYLLPVWRYAYGRLGGDRHAAEDVVSETFLAAVEGIRRIDPEGGTVYGWLVGIARHKVADLRRNARRTVPLPESGTHPPETGSAGNDPYRTLETAERRRQVAEAVDRLADDARLVLEWKYLDGLSVREIAGRLGRTEKAAEALLYRARGELRRRLSRSPEAER